MESCLVNHCLNARAVSVTFPTGFKFSYSGDCRPSKNFAEMGKNSTVLLHEATFDDELRRDAKAKRHSTTSEAIGVGLAMRARRILLTHFSQRYQKIPIMSGIDGLGVKLEDDVKTSDQLEGVENMSDQPLDNLADNLHEEANAADLAGPQLPSVNSNEDESGKTSFPSTSTHQALPKDLKIGVAFDYMRVKVADIMHLEKFTPALLKLFEESEKDEKGVTLEVGKEKAYGKVVIG